MSPAPIPKTAPFPEDEIELLNRVVGPASANQRAWLAGFLAGLDAADTAQQPSAPARAAEPLTILYATESGNSEKLAADAAKAARKLGLKPNLVDMADLDLAALRDVRRLLVIAATWGEGEAPARAASAYAELMSEAAPRLDGVQFAVLALGDTAYVEFCAIGKAVDARLEALGATRIADRVDCDLDFAAPAAAWINEALKSLAPQDEPGRGRVIEVDFGSRQASVELGPVQAEVIEHINLNSSRSDKETIHLELGFDGATPAYKPGDSLDLFAENDPVLVDEVMAAVGSKDDGIRNDLLRKLDVTTLSLKSLEIFTALTDHSGAKALLQSGAARDWIAGRQLIDLLLQYPVALSAEQIRAVTRPLSPRAYSIASSRAEVGDEAHLLIAGVRYQTHGRARSGVASCYAADRLKKGARVQVKLRPNKHFALPDAGRDIIMVGPGTGVAPFRAFVQDRRATGAPGRNWLFFGDRRYTHDFLYQLEWQEALADGSLNRMDVAFSRDGTEKRYVQHRIWEKRRDVVDWLDNGSHLYVCGDATAMAKDVRSTLVRALADVKALSPEAAEQAVRQLEREHRYQQDVY